MPHPSSAVASGDIVELREVGRLRGDVRPERRSVAQLQLADAAVALSAGAGSYLMRFGAAEQYFAGYLWLSLAFAPLWMALLGICRAYESRFLHLGSEEFRRVVHAGLLLSLLAALSSYALKAELARGYVLALVVLATAGTLVTRFALRKRLHRRRTAGAGWMRKVVVAGHDDEVAAVVEELGRTRWHGYEVAAVCLAEETSPQRSYDVPVVQGLDGVADASQHVGADTVVVLPCRHLGAAMLRRLGWRLERSGTQLLVAPGLVDVAHRRATICPVGNLALLHVDHAELGGVRRVVKDVFDRSAAAVLLLLATPLLLVLMTLIRLDTRGPALFRQERVGRGDRRFTVLKLRTMSADAEARRHELAAHNEHDGVLFKIRQDPRVTRVGRLLRRYSLDELPQLINVVRGQMSLVGPRPPLPSEVDCYPPDVRRRLVVKPGLTGLWQVSGRSDLPWDEAVRLDLRYVDNWSLMLDLLILWKTGRAVLSRSGAY